MKRICVFCGSSPGAKPEYAQAARQAGSRHERKALMAEVFLTLSALAALGLIFCARWFNREAVIFRGV